MPAEPDDSALRLRLQLLEQHRRLEACDQRFMAATRNYRKLVEKVEGGPTLARLGKRGALVTDCVQDLLDNTESVISLLSEGGRAQCAAPGQCHGLCLLMGKAQGLSPEGMQDLGMAALLRYRQDALAGFWSMARKRE